MIDWVKTGYRTTRPPGTGDDQGPTEVAVELCRDHRDYRNQRNQRNQQYVGHFPVAQCELRISLLKSLRTKPGSL